MSEVAWYATVTSGSEVVGIHPHNANCAAGCKPVVVIDPEDRGQVGALIEAWFDLAGDLEPEYPRMAAALRRLIPAEKPEEPTGLGAVVEDANGDFWVYAGLRALKDGETREWVHAAEKRWYGDIAATMVLSPGVPSC